MHEFRKAFWYMLVAFLGLFIAFRSCEANAQTSTTLEVQGQHIESGWVTTPDIYAIHHLEGSQFGVQAFAAITDGWAELYAGPTFAPVPELELSLMAGTQLVGRALEARYAASVWAGSGEWSCLIWIEFDHSGAGGVWYDLWIKYQPFDWLGVGPRARRFVGIGPTVWFSVPNTPIGLWLSWLPIGFEEGTNATRAVGAVSLTF